MPLDYNVYVSYHCIIVTALTNIWHNISYDLRYSIKDMLIEVVKRLIKMTLCEFIQNLKHYSGYEWTNGITDSILTDATKRQ